MMLQETIKKLRDALVDASTVKVYHYWRPNLKAPFIIWQEDGESSSLNLNNHKAQQGIYGTIDFFTKKEYDPVFDAIQAKLNSLEDFGWRYDATLFEDETNLIHHSWEWWLRHGTD